MINPLNTEEREYMDMVHETYMEMCGEKGLSVADICLLTNAEKWNVTRDGKKKANLFLITVRRKCKCTGVCMHELLRRAEEKMEKKKK